MKTRENPIGPTTINAGAYQDFGPYELATGQGAASVQLEITGDGEIKVEMLVRNGDSLDHLLSDGKAALATGLTKTSGPESDGKWHKEATSDHMGFCTSLIVRITETGGTASVGVSGVAAVR